jgi:HEAT repeat protein
MKNRYTLFISVLLFFACMQFATAQDKRTLETKTADLLAQMPTRNLELRNKLMEEFMGLGDQGFKLVANQITPSGQDDKSSAVFLLNGFTRYASQNGMDDKREFAERNFINAMNSANSSEVKAFFMRQLNLVGKEKAVKAVEPYLTDENLVNPAIAVLFSVKSQSAKTELKNALSKVNDKTSVSIIKALGELQVTEANAEILSKANTKDKNLKKVSLAALAEIAAPESFQFLLTEAKNSSFKYEASDATMQFLSYAARLGETGNLSLCKKACDEILKSCTAPELLHNNAAALSIYAKYLGNEVSSLLLKNFENPDKPYRVALLNLAEKNKDAASTKKWIAKAKKSLPDAKSEIITMLGKKGDLTAESYIRSELKNSSPQVSQAAIRSLIKLKGKEAVPALADLIKSGANAQFTGKELLSIMDEKSLDILVNELGNAQTEGKIAIINIIGAKAGQRFFDQIFKYTSDPDQAVKKASFAAIENVSSSSNIDQLIKLLSNSSDETEITNIQNGIVNALSGEKDENARVASLINQLPSINKKDRIIEILPRLGGFKALECTTSYMSSPVDTEKKAALYSLINWKDNSAASSLYQYCQSSQEKSLSAALKGFVRQISNSALPDDQKLLQYRKIMPFASKDAEKILIIQSIGKLKTFLSLITVSNYLDSPELSAAAAQSAMTIALPSQDFPGFNGTIVKGILKKAADKLTGSESQYDREKIKNYLAEMTDKEGFVSMFNGNDLSGWQGLVGNPVTRAKMKSNELAKKQTEANQKVSQNWSVKDGCIVFNGNGDNLCSVKEYGDFEMVVDWRITKKGDSGIYLRGSPQVQIWDTSRVDVGAQVGSGGLYNNQKNQSKPLKVSDNPIGEWNTFRIKMVGERVTVWLNGELVVNNVPLENYWDRSIPIFPKGSIELQAHGTDLAFRDIYVKEINNVEYKVTPEEETAGFKPLFNGKNFQGWTGNTVDYQVENGEIVLNVDNGPSHGNLYTEGEYKDFTYRFEFQLTPGANNGLGIRAPLSGDAAYVGMELQILDNDAPIYAQLKPYQYHGSVYGIIPAKRGYLKPTGEWNYQEVTARGNHITITLNGTVILDGDIKEATKDGTPDHREHPGLFNEKGHIGFLGHGSVVKFRNIRIKEI